MTFVNSNIRATSATPLGRRLKAARILAGVDQYVMAQRLGVSRSALAMWEQGRTEPSATYFIKLADECGVTLEWLSDGVLNETAPAVAGAGFARPEGLEPPTFCSVVSIADSNLAFLIGLIGAVGAFSRRI